MRVITKKRVLAAKRTRVGGRQDPRNRLDATDFKPPVRWRYYGFNAFQVPLDPMHDPAHLGNIPGQIIENTRQGDFSVLFRYTHSGQFARIMKRLVSKLGKEIADLKAANELLRRFQEENENPRLQLLRALRHESSEFVIRKLAEHLVLSVEKLAINSAALDLLIKLERSGYVSIKDAVVSTTDAGKEFLQKKLRVQTNHVA